MQDQISGLTRSTSKRYTLHMKQTRILSALLLLLALLGMLTLAACAPGSLGNEGIAFVRDGKLWTIDPNGSNAFAAVAQSMPVLCYGLSPDHQICVFRTLDGDFAKTPAGKHLEINPITGLVGDVPGLLSTIGIDGRSPIPLVFSTPDLPRSNAWWSPNGDHLLYREGASSTLASPDLVTWWVAQDDQPLNIARKFLPNSYSIPSITADSSLAIGNSMQRTFTTTLAGEKLSLWPRRALP